mgnify:CR=1 FL=1
MTLDFFKEVSLETLRRNIEINLKNYDSSTNEWIFNFFEGNSPFLEFKKDFPDFELDTSFENPAKSDFKNLKILYSALKGLSIGEASSENLWAGMSHGNFWDYIKYRNFSEKKIITEESVKNSFFFSHGKRISLITHPLSKLWWTGYLIYDENRKNPFELLEVFKNNFEEKLFYLFSSTLSNSPSITKAFLSAIHDFEKNGVKINTKLFQEVITYLNILAGTYILDYFEVEELKEKIIKKIDSLLMIMD